MAYMQTKTITEKESEMKTIRDKAIIDTDTIATKPRHGLFQYPVSLAIGDNNDTYNASTQPIKDENGKVLIAPRGIYTNPCKSGRVKSSYLSSSGYVTIGDKYIDPLRREKMYELEKKKLIKEDQPIFKPAGKSKYIIKASYQYMEQTSQERVLPKKDDAGKVLTMTPNILTGPCVKGVNKPYIHLPDEYDRLRMLQKQEIDQHHAKLGEKPSFKTYSHGNETFLNAKKTYGLDKPQPPVRIVEYKVNKANHESAFRPSNPAKQGYNKTLGKIPEYLPDPIREAVRKAPEENAKEAFKPNRSKFSVPTPTISCNKLNLKREMIRVGRSITPGVRL